VKLFLHDVMQSVFFRRATPFLLILCLAMGVFQIIPDVSRADEDEPFGLIQENDHSATKIILILVHGANSYKQERDRWDFFFDWVGEHPDFDQKYEIWRFHHDTRELIGFDGNSGNARELGDAIMAQFGPDRPILFLAHSRGGLVTRAYMNGYGDGLEGDRVLGLVTLGSPHHGSPGAVPDWGLMAVNDGFEETDLADILYGFDDEAVVNITDMGTMNLAWDNFDGPENGMAFHEFNLASPLGDDHTLSVMDANIPNPVLEAEQADTTLYLPDRSGGTLAEMNADDRYFGRIIAYGGYDTSLGLGSQNPFDWLELSLTDHAGLEMATHLMAEIPSRSDSDYVWHYMANDGMVPLQSALLLKKDAANEPIYTADEDTDLFAVDTISINLKDITPRMNFRKAVLCPDFDHLHMVEGKGGVLSDRTDFWDNVAGSLDTLAGLTEVQRYEFSPQVETFEPMLPPLEEVLSSDNCFIGVTGTGSGPVWGWGWPLAAMLAAAMTFRIRKP